MANARRKPSVRTNLSENRRSTSLLRRWILARDQCRQLHQRRPLRVRHLGFGPEARQLDSLRPRQIVGSSSFGSWQVLTHSCITSADSTIDLRPVPAVSHFPLARNAFAHAAKPPSTAQLLANLAANGLSDVLYKDPFYSKAKDVPTGAREFAGKSFSIEGDSVRFLKPFLHFGMTPAVALAQQSAANVRIADVTRWEFAERPPSKTAMREWLVREGELFRGQSWHARREANVEVSEQNSSRTANQGSTRSSLRFVIVFAPIDLPALLDSLLFFDFRSRHQRKRVMVSSSHRSRAPLSIERSSTWQSSLSSFMV